MEQQSCLCPKYHGYSSNGKCCDTTERFSHICGSCEEYCKNKPNNRLESTS
jgi:hypothetical protein